MVPSCVESMGWQTGKQRAKESIWASEIINRRISEKSEVKFAQIQKISLAVTVVRKSERNDLAECGLVFKGIFSQYELE